MMMMMMMMPLVQKYVWFEDKIRISWSFQEQVMFLEDVMKICRRFTEHLMRTSGEKHCFLETSMMSRICFLPSLGCTWIKDH